MYKSDIIIIKAETQEYFEKGKLLFKEYAESLSFDLTYQDFEKELLSISQQYNHPEGCLLLCLDNSKNAIGCVGARKFSDNIAELKRLYVKPGFRAMDLGKKLLQAVIDITKELKYDTIRLDTVPGQIRAQELYRHFGFYEISPYRYSPIPGTIYLEKILVENS